MLPCPNPPCYLIELLAGANLWQTHIHIRKEGRGSCLIDRCLLKGGVAKKY